MAGGESGKRLSAGHDGKGAVLGDAVNDGRVHVAPPPQAPDRATDDGAPIRVTLDGRAVDAQRGETIWQLAKRH
ncbi:MAG: hypothetical protein ACXWU8_07245, partial [Rhodoplanes sp.]